MDYGLTHGLMQHGFRDAEVLAALMRVDSGAFGFSTTSAGDGASEDERLPAKSPAFIVASMTSALGVHPGERVLEVGTGTGYQAAVLAELGCEVFSIERIKETAEHAALALLREGYRVHLRSSDGTLGWPEEAPFHGILVSAGASEIPRALVNQLIEGRRLIIPLGEPNYQRLCVVTKHGPKYMIRELMDVSLSPLISG